MQQQMQPQTTDHYPTGLEAMRPADAEAYRQFEARCAGWNDAAHRDIARTFFADAAVRVIKERAGVGDPCFSFLDVEDGLNDRFAAGEYDDYLPAAMYPWKLPAWKAVMQEASREAWRAHTKAIGQRDAAQALADLHAALGFDSDAVAAAEAHDRAELEAA